MTHTHISSSSYDAGLCTEWERTTLLSREHILRREHILVREHILRREHILVRELAKKKFMLPTMHLSAKNVVYYPNTPSTTVCADTYDFKDSVQQQLGVRGGGGKGANSSTCSILRECCMLEFVQIAKSHARTRAHKQNRHRRLIQRLLQRYSKQHTHTHTYTHINTHKHTHTHTHTTERHTYTNTHTHMRAQSTLASVYFSGSARSTCKDCSPYSSSCRPFPSSVKLTNSRSSTVCLRCTCFFFSFFFFFFRPF